MRARHEIRYGGGSPVRTLVIGRSPSADVVIADASLAPHHAELVVTDDGRLYVTDCATDAGTWIRGEGSLRDGSRSGRASCAPISRSGSAITNAPWTTCCVDIAARRRTPAARQATARRIVACAGRWPAIRPPARSCAVGPEDAPRYRSACFSGKGYVWRAGSHALVPTAGIAGAAPDLQGSDQRS